MTASDPAVLSTSHDAVSRRAADYFQRRRFWAWSDADQAELDAWLAESIFHRAAYLRVEGIVARTDRLATLRPLKFKSSEIAPRRKIRLRTFLLPLLAAASIALIATLAVPFVSALMQPPDRTYSTDVGGRTLLSFADHTQIELNTETVARFRMTNKERTVWLEKGEAWFHVSHDAAHPFSVIVGRHRVTDLGTEFFVRRGADGMEVALLNGRAALSTEGAPTATLVPGDDAVETPLSMSVIRRTPQQLADALAWRRGMLVFRNTRLADAVREFNRYNQTKLIIADPSIADLKVTAEIKNDNYEDFLQLAQDVLNLHADREGGEILISRVRQETTKKAARSRSSSEAVAHVMRGD